MNTLYLHELSHGAFPALNWREKELTSQLLTFFALAAPSNSDKKKVNKEETMSAVVF